MKTLSQVDLVALDAVELEQVRGGNPFLLPAGVVDIIWSWLLHLQLTDSPIPGGPGPTSA